MTYVLFLVITILLMPFVTHHRSMLERFFFFIFSMALSPLLGLPLYWYMFRR